MSDHLPPVPPITVEIKLGGEDWAYIVRSLERIAEEAATRGPSCFSMASGGGGGSYHTSCETRDVSPEAYRAELSEWFDAMRLRRDD